MDKIICASQNTGAKIFSADVCVCGHFGNFYLLLSTQLTADLTPESSGGSMFHSFSYIYAKNPFCGVETVANNALNRRRVVVFD